MSHAPTDAKTVPCKWCGDLTRMTGTRQCDGCWELSSRIRDQPDLAARMLRCLKGEEKEPE